MENHHFFIGKSTINGPFSIAILVYQAGYVYFIQKTAINGPIIGIGWGVGYLCWVYHSRFFCFALFIVVHVGNFSRGQSQISCKC